MTLFEKILHIVNNDWKESLYFKPIVESVLVVAFSLIWKSKRNVRLKQVGASFCIGFFLIFISADISFVIFKLLKPKYSWLSFVKTYELINGLFVILEYYLCVELVNYELKINSFRLYGKFLGGLLIIANIFTFYALFEANSGDECRMLGELASGLSYAFFTMYLTMYYLTIYKQNIMSTFVTPTIYAFFCYVVLSLLFFPCSAFLRLQTNVQLSILINSYHLILIVILAIILVYNVRKHPIKPISYLKFEI